MSEIINKVKKLGFSNKFAVWASVVFAVFCFTCLAVYAILGKDTVGYIATVMPIEIAIVGFTTKKSQAENIVRYQNNNTENIQAKG